MSEKTYGVFIVTVLQTVPYNKAAEDEPAPKLVLAPTALVARSEQDAAIKIVMGNDKLKDVDKDRIEVLVRPF